MSCESTTTDFDVCTNLLIMSSSDVDVMQKKEDAAKKFRLPLKSYCSKTFWEEDFEEVPKSGLFHFTADIGDRPVAVTIDKYSLTNLVSIEVVKKLHLPTYKHVFPYMLATHDHAVPVTMYAYFPLTIYGHTICIECDVVPRTLNFCNLMLGKY